MKICVKCNKQMEDDMMFCSECGVKYLTNDLEELVFEGCPVSVAGNFLLMDEDRLMVNLTLKNQSDDVVKAVTVRLKCFDQMEDGLEDTVVKLMDLSVQQGEFFGYDVLNPVVDKDTRSVKIIIEKVLLEQKGLISTPFSEFTKTDTRAFIQLSSQIRDNNVRDIYLNRSKMIIENWAKWLADEEKTLIELKKWTDEAEKLKPIINKNYNTIAQLANTNDFTSLKLLNRENGKLVDKLSVYKDNKRKCEELVKTIHQLMKDSYAPVVIVPQECERLNLIRFGANANATTTCSVTFEEGAVPRIIECQNSQIGSIILPEGLRVINKNAFDCCRSLKKVVIPSTVTSIEDNAFRNCLSLKEIFIPSSVTTISTGAFWGCNAKIIKQADIDRENYWKEHPEQKQRLEARKETAENEIAELEKQKAPFDEQLKQLNNERRNAENVPAKIEYEEIQKKLKELSNQYAALGIFKGKEKKAINDQILELQAKGQDVFKEIEPQQKEYKRNIGQKIKDIEESEEYKNIIEQIKQNREMIDSVNKEFERNR